jgi:hypothetical protein
MKYRHYTFLLLHHPGNRWDFGSVTVMGLATIPSSDVLSIFTPWVDILKLLWETKTAVLILQT